MKPSQLIILLALNFFWAATLSAYKVVAAALNPADIVTLRFGLAAVSLLVLWPWLPGTAPRGRDLIKTCVIGALVFVLGHRLQVFGNSLGTAADSSLLMALEPLVASVAAAIFLREHIGPRRWCGFAFGILGVALLKGVWRSDFHWLSLGASLIFISSFVCEAAYSVIGKPIIHRAGPVKVLALALAVGTGMNLLWNGASTVRAATQLSGSAWLIMLALALICTSFGYSYWFMVIRESDVSVAALTIFAQPVFGVALAKFWLGETLHWGQLWGSVAIVVGLMVGLSRQIMVSGPPKDDVEVGR